MTPNGTVKDAFGLDFVFWKSKNNYIFLNEKIDSKLAKYCPNNNILFENL